ncbi:acyltransferase 3 [Rhodomicrobium vannielii ATCC 17100]|uniref:Acyltransferase 3 n=1 Tax=Rhodomicrobium vannielii (strain ATCC 17100 / DSM 162 / LMG 4299 / NCIMB 10020 / ATH 3.1.1) TaxID=648757 RepID=E3I2Z7_RHOVT|nr:acyltransferase family protein [Rhodomicrobium vannielii]ADP70291.1 acyltransferase 3 [Rhodomicrobium vannielii ATCC 17100]
MINYRPEVDGLRAVAIASVVLFHTGSPVFAGGYVGVDIFFVISGYLITSIMLKARNEGGFSYLDFYARRARRILPALFAMLALVSGACLLLLATNDLASYGNVLAYTVLFAANIRLMGSMSYFHPDSQQNPLLHMWSLAVEEQFYILWPTLLLGVLALISARRAKVLFVALAVGSLIVSEIHMVLRPEFAFYQLPSRGWELLAGALLAVGIAPPIRSHKLAEAVSLTGLSLMIAPVLFYDKTTSFPGLAALPPVLGCAFVIWAETGRRTRFGSLLRLKPVVFLGLISYSLYLWHWPVFALTKYVMIREPTHAESALLVALAVLAGWASWRFVERPFRHRPASAATSVGRERSGPRVFALPFTLPAYGAGAFAAVLVATGAYFQLSGGASWRFSPDLIEKLDAAFLAPPMSCARSAEIAPGLEKCETGRLDGGTKNDVVMWGDSHARHYQALIAAVYGDTTTLYRPRCTPVAGVYLTFERRNADVLQCFEQKAAVLADLVQKRPRVVILAGRWGFAETATATRTLYERPDMRRSRDVFAAALRETVSRLTDAGIKVVLMAQVPEIRVPTSHCLGVYKHVFGWTDCYFVSRNDYVAQFGWTNDLLRSIADDTPNVAVFWPAESLCEGDVCRPVRDGKHLYSDNNHLTAEGALSLVSAYRSTVPAAFLPLPEPRSVDSAWAPSPMETGNLAASTFQPEGGASR